jgi:predicted acylesterase/phospholipase RssA
MGVPGVYHCMIRSCWILGIGGWFGGRVVEHFVHGLFGLLHSAAYDELRKPVDATREMFRCSACTLRPLLLESIS